MSISVGCTISRTVHMSAWESVPFPVWRKWWHC